MKTLEATSRGRGGGRARGGGRRGGGRAAVPPSTATTASSRPRKVPRDPRFEARLYDPRFTPPPSMPRRRSTPEPDARFGVRPLASLIDHPPADEPNEEEGDEEEEVDEADVTIDASDVGDDEVAAYEGSECSYVPPTRRVAVVRCDWDHVRAVDLFSILSHAVPLGGALHRVSIYKSSLGKVMIEQERRFGPDLWDSAPNGATRTTTTVGASAPSQTRSLGDDDDDDDDEGVEGNGDATVPNDADGTHVSSGKHRRYELQRLRYYYAIAEFDSAATAAVVYADLDGIEVEASGVTLDLRYVDDDETFSDDEPESTATAIPPSFRPLKAFTHAAASQCQFEISWDRDDAFRSAAVRETFERESGDDDDDANVAAYLASESDDEAAEARHARDRAKYAELLSMLQGAPVVNDKDEATADDIPSDGLVDEWDFEDDDDDDLNDELAEGEVSGTIRLDATERATALQTQVRRTAALTQAADLGERAKILYTQRRKESRKLAKRQRAEEASKKETPQLDDTAERVALVERLGDAVEVPKSILHAERRERRKRERQQEARDLRTQRRAARASEALRGMGDSPMAAVSGVATEANATTNIDSRFDDKLVGDARYHIDLHKLPPAQRRALTPMAMAVTSRRVARGTDQAKRQRNGNGRDGAEGTDVDGEVTYFERRRRRA